MTFYFKLTELTSNSTNGKEGEIYLIKVIVDKIQRRIYKIKGQLISHVAFNQSQQFISLSGTQYSMQIKLFKQDHYQSFSPVAQINFQKQSIIREMQLESKPNKQIVSCSFQLNLISEGSKQDKMTKDLPTYKIKLEVKFDRYKKILGRMKNNAHFLEDLKYLDEDLQSLERLSMHAAYPRASFINKDHILPPDTKTTSTIDTKVGNLYIGSCYTKNMFSFLDPDNNEHTYSIVEPQYQN